MDLVSLIPIAVALIAGGGVAFYHARPRRDSIIAEASEKAVTVVTVAITRLEEDNKLLRTRVAVLEAQLLSTTSAALTAAAVADERINKLRNAVEKLGGDVAEINRVGKKGPIGEQGPPGPPGERGP